MKGKVKGKVGNQLWNQALAEAIAQQGQDAFWPVLCQGLLSLASIEKPMVIYYSQSQASVVLYDSSSKKEYQEHVARYLETGIYLLDPFYQASLNGQPSGLYGLKEVAPDQFKKTEFYRRYYQGTGVSDEVSYLISLADNEYLHVSLSLSKDKPRFTPSELNTLRLVAPVVVALVEKHWQTQRNESGGETENLHQQMQQVLQYFGSSLLTDREQQVLQLVLHGHSNQSVADRLGVSLPTVKLHRKNAYQKLDITSQAELFHLFIDSLSEYQPEQSKDPLAGYL